MMEVIKTFFLAMTPIGELRASLPIALTVYNMNWVLAFFVSVIGNLVPIIFLLLFLGPVSDWLSGRFLIFKKFFTWLFKRTRIKSSSKMQKYGELGLMIFVAIPLPFTGAWTGAVVAFLFGIPFKKALYLISSGVIIAGVIVLSLIKAGIWLI